MEFTLESFFNPHLALGASRMDAVFTIGASGAAPVRQAGQRAVGFIVDISSSMDSGNKMGAAKNALYHCIDMLDESTLFSVVGLSTSSSVVVNMTSATEAAKTRAHAQILKLTARGGTLMSTGLNAMRDVFESAGNVIGYVQFLTDGENDPMDEQNLVRVLDGCKGVFRCDCRGVGTDWRPKQLRLISEALLGTADAAPDPDRLKTDFAAALGSALSKGMGHVRLRLWSPKTVRLVGIKQTNPEIVDLMSQAARIDEKTLEIPLGDWGEEERDYHLSLELQPGDPGDEMMACRPSMVFSDEGQETKVAGQPIIATWTSNDELSTRINQEVAHYTGQEELAESIREGLEAKERGDMDQASVLLGKAARVAAQTGNEDVTRRLARVVDVIDADQGTVRLKSGAGKAEVLELDMGGARTVRRRPAK